MTPAGTVVCRGKVLPIGTASYLAHGGGRLYLIIAVLAAQEKQSPASTFGLWRRQCLQRV